MSTIPPKLPPASPAPRPKDKKAEKPEGEAEGVGHLASLHGLGLLAELAHMGDGLSQLGVQQPEMKTDALALDPRDRIDPKKKFIPK